MKTVLHIFTDSKFTGYIIHLFNEIEDYKQNYIVCTELEHLQFPNTDLSICKPSDLTEHINDLQPTLIIFHSLFEQNLEIASKIQTAYSLCWFSWGGDLKIEYSESVRERYGPITYNTFVAGNWRKKFMNRLWNVVKQNWSSGFARYYKWRTGTAWPNMAIKSILPKFQYINTVTFEEARALKGTSFKGKTIHIPIGSIEHLTDGVSDYSFQTNTKAPIFIGHSSFAENNQLDLLYELKNLEYDGLMKCSLSYGDPEYAQAIRATGTKLFGSNFSSLDHFLPKDVYFKHIQASRMYINNSLIQQGLGNILVALYLGVPVFLNRHGAIYKYLNEIGVYVFTIEDDLSAALSNELQIPASHHTNNRAAIQEVYGEQKIIQNINHFLDSIA